jgi:hypothetical protein
MKSMFAAALLSVCGMTHAGGYYLTGQRLLELFDGNEKGQAQALIFVLAAHDATSAEHCVPDSLTAGDVKDAVQERMARLTPLLGLPAIKLVASILRDAYPCSDDKAPASDETEPDEKKPGRYAL